MGKFKKVTATVLSAVMALSVMSIPVFAEENAENEEAVVEDSKATGFPEAQEGVIKLTEDVTVDTITVTEDITYDLNGNDLTYTGGPISFEGTTLRFIDSSVKGSKRGGTLELIGIKGTTSAINPKKDAAVEVKNINIECTGSAFYPQGDAAAVNIENCDLKAAVYGIGTNAATVDNYGVVINIENSKIITSSDDGDNTAVLINVDGELNIIDSELISDRQALVVRAGDAKVVGTKITVTGKFAEQKDGNATKYQDGNWKSGNEVPTGAIIAGNTSESAYKAEANLTIEDCEIESENKDVPAIFTDANKNFASEVKITGNETVVTGSVMKNNEQENADIVIMNGTFTDDVEEYLDEDSHLVKDEDGNYVAMDDKAFEESEKTFYINDVDDLELAVKNQADGVTWIFTGEDYEIDSTILITSDIIIEGNGSTIKVTTDISGEPNGSNSAIEIENGANVVINNISIDGNENVKHGINIFTAQGEDKIKVELNGVSIEDCKGYGVVNNASDLTVTDISTSGNGWGGINVDNSKSAGTDGASITINGGKIDEDNSLYFENANAEAGTTIDAVIKDGTFEGNVTVAGNNADVTIEDGKFNGKVEVTEDSNSDLTIENGKFTNDVSEYLDEDSHLVKDEDGNYIAMDEETYEDYLDDNKSHGSSFELEEKENNRKDDDDKDKEEDKKPEEPEEESIFSDVAINDPNYDAIVKVFEKGWMVGVSDGVFAPNGTLTRGMAATILWNKAGKPEPVNAAPFLDVTADAWYAKAVAWAYEQGIVLGYDAETFGPNDFVTTEQFTIMLDKSEGKTPAPYAGGAPNATRAWVASEIA